MEPKIIFEDEDILVLDKPAGITVNKADTTKEEMTVQDWAEGYLKIRIPKYEIPACRQARRNKSKIQNTNIQNNFEFRASNFEFFDRAGIVHRLDKETSGILLVAKNPESFVNLQKQFKERVVKKTYVALVHGKVIPEVGEINVPVGRLPWNRKRFGVVAGGREAVTEFRVKNLELRINKEPLTLLELYPKTGRTHQIRVHLKYFNHPIFSDPLYGGRKVSRNDRKILPRIFLHASKIMFKHPKTGKELIFESQLPEELKNFLNGLS